MATHRGAYLSGSRSNAWIRLADYAHFCAISISELLMGILRAPRLMCRAAGAMFDRFFWLLLESWSGMEIGESKCDQCWAIYDGQHCCPLQVIGECRDRCDGRTRHVDRYGRCGDCGSLQISNRRLLHGAAWPRH